jgi:hypothetical protein
MKYKSGTGKVLGGNNVTGKACLIIQQMEKIAPKL